MTNLEKFRHSLAHVMTLAALRLYGKEIKLGVGPATSEGFYQDFEYSFTESDLENISLEMKKIIAEGLDFKKELLSFGDALNYYQQLNQPYKLELLNNIIKTGSTRLNNKTESDEIIKQTNSGLVSFQNIDFHKDLCRGGHVSNTKELAALAWKLDRIAGAYWRGKESNPMLTRIYGIAFQSQNDLDHFLIQREEKKKNDHRFLGEQLDLFTFSELVGAGLPLFTPRGTIVRNLLKALVIEKSKNINAQEVTIPHLAREELYQISGHATKFSDELFKLESRYGLALNIKPVNCPHHTQIYASKPRSYKDLPIRYIESTMQYRDEKPGAIGGLNRVRSITVDDGHSFCRADQVYEECIGLIGVIGEIYQSFGLFDNYWVSISVRDYSAPEKYIGDPKDWDVAEDLLKKIATDIKLPGKVIEGEAALYGPKIDYMYTDNNGTERQLATIQVDFATPKNFGLEYTNNEGQQSVPVMVHRAILGSYERFIALILEKTKGHLPFWLAPEQVRILIINDKVLGYVEEIKAKLNKMVLSSPVKYNELRYSVDERMESLSRKIRDGVELKIPVLIVIGEKDMEKRTISIRYKNQNYNFSLETFEDELLNLVEQI